MSTHKPSSTLPTLDKLNATIPSDLDANNVVADWFQSFSTNIEAGNVNQTIALFVEDSYWRDILALTWDFRTFKGAPRIRQMLVDRLPSVRMRSLKLKPGSIAFQQVYPDLAWIQAMFDFETDVGLASGVVRLVPTANGEWKGHCVFTNLEDLKGFPEKIGALRNHEPNHGKWAEQRRQEAQFEAKDPVVLICGAGQSGLDLAARLKCLDVPTLVVEKNPKIGDNWRNRYEALCLHDPVWYDHMPYIPFPSTWPVFSPALKLADWLESYANSLELNVWTSTVVVTASQDEAKKWKVTVKRGDGQERVFHVNHLVFATGFGCAVPNIPSYPGMDEFKGQILHSTSHKKATDHAGKKVIVIGSCTSAHDIASDYCNHGIDVTMFQRSSTYVMTTKNGFQVLLSGLYSENAPSTDIADRINASYPNLLIEGIGQRTVLQIAEADKEILDGLKKRGFKLNNGYKDAGLVLTVWDRAGGYYLDVGASQLIIDGKIKLKNDSQIDRFTAKGLKFEDSSELLADVVVFATGLGSVREIIRGVCGDQIADKCQRIWGMNDEGEINGCWRDLGFQGLWYMMGNMALCRFHSKHVALQIKAMEENVFGTRYSL